MFDGWQYYSAAWLLLALALAVGLALFWRKPHLPEIVGIGVLFVAIIILYFFLRPTQGILTSEDARVIGQGMPVLLKFQSPYCVACLALKPTIDALEDEFAGSLIVLRIDGQEEVGRQFAQAYGFQHTPTFVYFDSTGVERWRLIGLFDEPRLRQELASP